MTAKCQCTMLAHRSRLLTYMWRVNPVCACVCRSGEDDEAVNYFIEHVPRIRAMAARDSSIQV
jgi:hypothetical protein